jgi:predicted nucleic acid-binding protein
MAPDRTGSPSAARSAATIVSQHNPDAHVNSIAGRADTELNFDPAAMPENLPVMLDTNFYVRRLKGKLPAPIDNFVSSRRILHSGIACAEMSIGMGILDPSHADTLQNRAVLLRALETIADVDMVSPSAAAWAEAGMLAGILARTQYLAKPKKTLTADQKCCQEGLRRKLINDALIFLSAREQNAILVSTNSKDMDLLLRFRPDAHVLLFK